MREPLWSQAEPAAARPAGHRVLVVDDSSMDRHLAGAIVQKMDGWSPVFAAGGPEALEILAASPPDVVLTDMLMPDMDGLQLVQAIRARHPGVPVILMTAHGSEDVAIQALQKGAASYVPKKSLARDLAETLDSVLSSARAQQQAQRLLGCMGACETTFVLENDTALIPPLVSFLEKDVERLKLSEPSGLVLLGVALHEALTNAMLHGNLGLSSSLRETDEKEYYRLSVARRAEPPYLGRRVTVTARLSPKELSFTIRDDGEGFDPNTLPDPTDASNLGKVSGRGLLLIRTFMDEVRHNVAGNEITLVKRRP